ncbi:MAG: hypothetical protein ABI665_17620 [Vicinamibacterales bacterium]
MVSVLSLWLPIIVAAVIVFLVSSVIHMATPWHKGDWLKVPSEDNVMNALRPFNLAPGDYGMPLAGSMANMNTPEFKDKLKKGPVIFMTVRQSGEFNMGATLFKWFLFSLLVGFFTAYVAGVALPVGADYLKVFQVSGCVAFMAYSFGQMPQSIWYSKNWGTTIKSMIDGLVYGLMTAGTFGWLWPK